MDPPNNDDDDGVSMEENDSPINSAEETMEDSGSSIYPEEENDIDENDDQIKDPEDDQIVDEKLITNIQQVAVTADEPEEMKSFDDEEKGNDDSGIAEGDVSDYEEIPPEQPAVIVQPIQAVGRGRYRKKALNENNQVLPPEQPAVTVQPIPTLGRGRYGKKPLNENNQELPPPRPIERVEPECQPKQLRMARLPAAYHRKREDPEEQKQRRAARIASSLLDFQATFSHITVVADKDDSKEKGYQHACRCLEEIQSDIILDTSKPHYDIWSFGLYTYPLALEKPISCSLLKLIPEKFDNEENRPFWIMFKRSPIFKDMKITTIASKEPNSPKGVMVGLDRGIYADLSSGALTSMSRFCFNKDYTITKRNRWTLHVHDEYFEIQTIKAQRYNNISFADLTLVKYKIPLDIIDRAAIIRISNDGFSLFLNMKGNIHELHREYRKRNESERNDDHKYDYEPFQRQGIGKGKAQPLFSTIRLQIRLRSDDDINHWLDQQNTKSNSTSSVQSLDTVREEALQQIREAFKHLLDFFYKNRIHVCFGLILQKRAALHQLAALDNHEFRTFIQSYSWTMLCNIGFRLQMQLFLSTKFINRLHQYSDPLYPYETSEDIDGRFYRLCLYLHRRSSEYFFLSLDDEIEIGIDEYKDKYERLKLRKVAMNNFLQVNSSTAYIPSVVITPTTIKIRPLKLCKLNRVLREERFGSVLNFALVELRDEAQRSLFPTVFRALKDQILRYLTEGFHLTPSRVYKYLHHSQSQVKCKQFWFYYHDEKNGHLSHQDAYTWMGNFDKERVVAKHAARIALCFTSTDATIQITADKVSYVRDVKDVTGKYAFTDGVGTISTQLRDQIQRFLGKRYAFSVLQIRYGGCKGTLSVDPRLDNQKYQLQIRDSMNKFTTDHDILELCKLSAPRALYLNRQDIVLLESRDIPHTNFLHLQNEEHFWLIQALIMPSIAFELLQEKILPVFQLRTIARNLNIVKEQFFIKLIITCAFNIIREVIDRTRIRISNTEARNMFGIVDEYAVLESGQVFVQYTLKQENRLDTTIEEEKAAADVLKIRTGKVVITKNPCHHPGDLRVFDAVDHPKLRHLKDVVVFPQKGPRPHSNEISGSDLDGDEYVVIWLDDLIPKTLNETPYDYDSQDEPKKMTRPITRDDINQIVMEVSEQDCLGSLSNIHLAYVDRDGIKAEICKKLAGDISQEVDAAKTGKHPLSEKQIIELRSGLNDTWPDFMKARGKSNFYPSERVLGKLYRSARRAVNGWSRAISNHGNPHHIHLALALTAGNDPKNQANDEPSSKANTLTYYKQPLDPHINHPDFEKYRQEIRNLYQVYRSELLEIISLYRFQDEIDLFCCCESMDASAGSSKKGGLEDSATIEVKNLVERITQDFYHEFKQRMEIRRCCKYVIEGEGTRAKRKRITCNICAEDILAKAACAYIHSYEESNHLPLKSNRRILSFPWLFATHLLKLRERNNPQDKTHLTDTIVGPACDLYLKEFTLKFKVLIPSNSAGGQLVEFCYEKRTDGRKTDEKIFFVPLLRACFIEILNDWLIKQKIFGNECIETNSKPLIPESIWHELIINFLSYEYQPNVRPLSFTKYQTDLIGRYRQTIEEYRLKWTSIEHQELQKMFETIHLMAAKHAKEKGLTIWSYLDEYILLALQCIGIEKRLVENWI